MTMARGRTRFVVLDGLRGVAAFGVVIGHALVEAGRTLHFHLAVDFFFMLSGFVVAYAYSAKLAAGLRWWDFVQIRLRRLYPLLALGVGFGFCYALLRGFLDSSERLEPLDALSTLARGLLLIPGENDRVGQGAWPLDVPSWSLFDEFAVNFIWAGVAAWLWGLRLRLMVLIGMAATLFVAVAFGHMNLGHDEYSLFGGLARVAFAFPAGVLMFELYRNGRLPALRIPTPVLAVALIAALAMPFRSFDPWGELFVVFIVFPVILVAGINAPDLKGPLGKAAAASGELSYPLYILHYPILLLAAGAMNTVGLHDPALIAATSVAAALATATIAHLYYDLPLRRLLGAPQAAPERQAAP